MNDQILQTISRIIIPPVIVFGSYVTVYGHITPGGGFPGGTLLAAAVILYTLSWGRGGKSATIGHRASEGLESGALLLYLLIGGGGVYWGGAFLTNLGTGIAPGEFGTVISAGFIPVIGVLIGVKVANTVVRLFHAMIEDDRDDGSDSRT